MPKSKVKLPPFSKKYFKILLLIVPILGFFTVKDYYSKYIGSSKIIDESASEQPPVSTVSSALITINEVNILSEIADTPEKKAAGLSHRESLDEDRGMLFIFDTPSMQYFWMKDMLIPLDIIWILNNEIVDIHKNVPLPKKDLPLNQLSKYSPKEKVNYVLEVNAGFTDKHNIEIGDMVDIIFK